MSETENTSPPIVTNQRDAARELGIPENEFRRLKAEPDFPNSEDGYDLLAIRQWLRRRENADKAARPPRGRQAAAAPVCPIHECDCVSRRSEPFFTRYYCPEPNCSFSHKQPRPELLNTGRKKPVSEDDFGAR